MNNEEILSFDSSTSFEDILVDDCNFDKLFKQIVANYYQFCPNTLMPLLITALASKGKLRITENKFPIIGAFRSFDLDEMSKKSWVRGNTSLSKKLKGLLDRDIHSVDIEMELDPQTAGIYGLFKEHDEVTVVHEYYERIGILVDHAHIDKQQKEYSLLILANYLLENIDKLHSRFITMFETILVESGLQPKRPRLEIADALTTFLNYNGKGIIYNPFAGISYVGAMLNAGSNLYADGSDPRILAAGQLLNYGVGGNNVHFIKHDSTQWMYEKPLDYVVTTYRGNVGNKCALCFCLDKCFSTLSETGKYAGVIKSPDLFDKKNPEIIKAIDEDLLDSIIVMPFNETILLFNKKKENKGVIRIYNKLTGSMEFLDPKDMLTEQDEIITISNTEIKHCNYNLKKYVVNRLEPISGQELVPIKKFIQKIPQRTYDLSKLNYRQKVMLHINRSVPYTQLTVDWMVGLNKTRTQSLLNPAYKLDADSLIISSQGNIEPRLFDADLGTAYFNEGLAFKFLPPFNIGWFMQELRSPYVQEQIHPYGQDAMIPNEVTEDMILSLKLYQPTDCSDEKTDNHYLEPGTILHDKKENLEFTIQSYINNGSFGITYKALQKDILTDDITEVVMKECFMDGNCYRENNIVKYHNEYAFKHNFDQFMQEAKIMMDLGSVPDSHIMQVTTFFESEETGTAYYVMKNYTHGNLEDLMKSRTLEESYVINNIVKPLTKALSVAHAAHLMHLDIKPDNIMIDDNGYATLTDFGLAKLYDNEGLQISDENPNGCRYFAAPEQIFREPGNALVRFAPQTDIYLLAGTIYFLLTRKQPHHIMDFSDQDIDIRNNMNMCSKQMQDAIVAGLQNSATARPATAQAFLNLFPGCEDIKL